MSRWFSVWHQLSENKSGKASELDMLSYTPCSSTSRSWDNSRFPTNVGINMSILESSFHNALICSYKSIEGIRPASWFSIAGSMRMIKSNTNPYAVLLFPIILIKAIYHRKVTKYEAISNHCLAPGHCTLWTQELTYFLK